MTTGKLVATIEQRRSGARLIKFAGVLDENSHLDDLLGKVGRGTALINLSGVERINSKGARDWVNFIGTLDAKGIRPMLIACSPAVVAQLNRVKNFAGKAIVKSFQVPYHCSTCGIDKLQLVHVTEMGAAPYRAPGCSCDACGGTMQFLDDPESYFAFVSDQQRAKRRADASSRPELARGSGSPLTTEHIKRISQPRISLRDSRPSFAAFDMAEERRQSDLELFASRRTMAVGGGGWLFAIIAIVTLLLGTAGVLFYMLLA
jgi:anti-anti-sigma regulatory factor